MTARRALFIQGDGSNPQHTAEETRALFAALLGGQSYDAVAPAIGAIARGHGVLSAGSLAVTPNGTPNNTVHVAAGLAAVRGTQENDQGVYVIGNDGSATLNVTASPTNPRRDLVIAQIRDDQYPTFSDDDWTLTIVPGTPAGSPVDPAVPEDALVLARLRVPVGVSAVVSAAEIDDLRPRAVATGGILPVDDLADYPSPQLGDAAYLTTAGARRLWLYDGSSWVAPYAMGVLAPPTQLTGSSALTSGTTNLDLAIDQTIDIPANRRIRVSFDWRSIEADAAVVVAASIKLRQDGALIKEQLVIPTEAVNAAGDGGHIDRVLTPSAGSHTYDVLLQKVTGGANVRIFASSSTPAQLVVEDIGPTSF